MAQSPAPPILLLDGGLGTSLEDLHGVEFSEKTPLWSGHLLISSPRMLQELHSAFAAAGADVIETATYQTSFAGFSKTPRTDSDSGEVGYSRDEAEHYMRTAVAIARRAIDSSARQDNALLALSLGPLGATLTPSAEFTGAYPVQYADWQGLHAFHDERLRVFAHDAATWALVDVVAFETLPVAREVRAVREGMARLQREGLGRPYWVACVFREDLTLPDGSKVAEVVREMLAPGLPQPHAIGINCTKPHLLPALLSQFEAAPPPSPPPYLVLYPDNADHLVYNTGAKAWEPAAAGGGGMRGGGSGTSRCGRW